MTVWILSTCAIVAALMLLRLILKGRMDPRLTYALWLLAALRILIPGSLFQSPASVEALAERTGVTGRIEEARYAPERATMYAPGTYDPADEQLMLESFTQTDTAQGVWGGRDIAGMRVVDVREPSGAGSSSQVEVEIVRDRSFPLRLAWYAGAALVGAWFLVVNLRFARRLRRERVPFQGELPVRCPLSVYVVENTSPCLAGLFRPAVYLNRAAVESERLDHILTHELTHCRHGDHWWALLRCVCVAVQWFDPLVWIAAYLSRQDCESACDASAIKALGEGERIGYGRTLVDMIAVGRAPSAVFSTATTMSGGVKSIYLRISLIAKKPKMTVLTLTAVLLIAALAVGCAFGGAGESGGEDPPPEGTGAVESLEPEYPGEFDPAPLLELPEDLKDLVTVVAPEDGENGGELCAYYLTAEYDPEAEDKEWGRLCAAYRLTHAQFEVAYQNSLIFDGITFPGLDGSYYYEFRSPNDAPFSEENVQLWNTARDRLYSWLNGVFAGDPAIRPLDLSETPFVDDYSYSGNHLDVTVYPYNDRDDPDAQTWTLVLSQPAKQGEGGIWCVERYYMGGTDSEPYYNFYNIADGLTASEFYAQIQERADRGEQLDPAVASLAPSDLATAYVHDVLGLLDFQMECGEVYSAEKGASRGQAGPAIVGELTPASRAQAVFDAIVGEHEGRDFDIDVFGVAGDGAWRYHITEDNDFNVENRGIYLDTFDWGEDYPGDLKGAALLLSNSTGDTSLRCWQECEFVDLSLEGEHFWLTCGPDHGYTLYDHLLLIAEDAALDDAWNVTVDGSVSDYEEVIRQYAQAAARRLTALPEWHRQRPQDAQVSGASVRMAYTGEPENFCGGFGFYFKLEDGESSGWQAGSGMDQVASGPYEGYWRWGIGASFARNSDGDWYCTGFYTGGASLTYPKALSEASVAELVDFFFHCTGDAREYRLPLELRDRSVQQFSALSDVLDRYGDGQAKELCEALGAHMKQYADHGLSLDDAAGALREPYRSYIKDAYDAAQPIG